MAKLVAPVNSVYVRQVVQIWRAAMQELADDPENTVEGRISAEAHVRAYGRVLDLIEGRIR